MEYKRELYTILATASYDSTIKIWKIDKDFSSIQYISTLAGHEHYVTCLNFHSNGKWLVSGGTDGKLCVWDIIQKRNLISITAHEGGINGLCLSDKNNFIFTGSSNQSVRCWQIKSGLDSIKIKLLWTSRSRFSCEETCIERTKLLAEHARLFQQRGAIGNPAITPLAEINSLAYDVITNSL